MSQKWKTDLVNYDMECDRCVRRTARTAPNIPENEQSLIILAPLGFGPDVIYLLLLQHPVTCDTALEYEGLCSTLVVWTVLYIIVSYRILRYEIDLCFSCIRRPDLQKHATLH